MRVLLIDDNDDMRAMLAEALLVHDCEVTQAESGEKALELLGQSEFDVVISDLVMPGIDGIHLAEKVIAEYEGIAVVVVSGAPVRLPDSLADSGRVVFLPKPFTPTRLAATARELVGGR